MPVDRVRKLAIRPCGAQFCQQFLLFGKPLYALRYGTIPIVRSIGGLKDTVPDLGEPDGSGRGIRFDQFSVEDAVQAVYRAANLWHEEPGALNQIRKRIMAVDSSWENALRQYAQVYRVVGADIRLANPG